MTETYSQRMAREAAEFRDLAGDLVKLADAADGGRQALRKVGGGDAESALGSMATKLRRLAESMEALASAPIPRCFQETSPTDGAA